MSGRDAEPIFESNLKTLVLISRGKVRDIYDIDEQHMLIVATDRLSAFDVVLPDPIPDKGQVLTSLSNFWFERSRGIVPNHLCALRLETVLPDASERRTVQAQATVVRKHRPLAIEAIVRGYLIGSGWKDYQASGKVCGIKLPSGLRLADRLPRTMFTPSTKAAMGSHDQNIDFDATVGLLGAETAERVRDLSVRLYEEAAGYALERGIIIADTKFEFGTDEAGNVVLIDEVLTPDSSRFWPVSSYRPGTSPESFDKQFVRDYLEEMGWNKRPPAPHIPAHVIARTAEKYLEAKRRLI